MATGVTIYKSTDGSAPTLSGTAGDLVALLDACLVNGYGSKPAAGWTKPFTGTNAAAFLQGAGCGFYLDVNDNGPGAGGAREARLRGYETMSAVATGTGLFPTAAQLAAGLFCRKSATADGTTRSWVIAADDRTLYLFIDSGDSLGYTGFFFGDFYSVLAGDTHKCLIVGRTTENTSSNTAENASRLSTAVGAVTAGHYIARTYTGLGTAITASKTSDNAATGGVAFFGGGAIDFPNPPDGSFIAAPVYIHNPLGGAANEWRGQLRGLLNGINAQLPTDLTDGDTVDSVTGRSYMILGRTPQSAASYYVIETSDTWDTNT